VVFSGIDEFQTVKLPQSTLCEFGVNRQCKYRALQWLEDAKLISVKVDVGQAPLVTLRDVMEE
jgi:hypothetical protein